MLIKDRYSPRETLEIINKLLEPIPELEIIGLSELAEKGELRLYGKMDDEFQIEIVGEVAYQYCKKKVFTRIPKFSGFITSVFFLREDIEKFIKKSKEPLDKEPLYEGDTPTPIKGKPKTLAAWMKYFIEVKKGLDISLPLPSGLQNELIQESEKYGYVDGSAVKKAWASLGLKSAHNTKNI